MNTIGKHGSNLLVSHREQRSKGWWDAGQLLLWATAFCLDPAAQEMGTNTPVWRAFLFSFTVFIIENGDCLPSEAGLGQLVMV